LCDRGSLNGVKVIEVLETDSGDVEHITRRQVGKKGDMIEGVVDKERRNRNRQLHTAQHILSQAFVKLFGYETVSVHLGEEYGAVELKVAKVSGGELSRAESMANEIIEHNYPVETSFVERDEARKLPLRKVPKRAGTIRVVKIGEFDWSACGGTHCLSTLEVGLIKITGVEKMRRRMLVKFLAGNQAFDDYRLRFSVTDELARSLTCHVGDLPSKITKLIEKNKELEKEIFHARTYLLLTRVDELFGQAETTGDIKLVADVMDDLDVSQATELATTLADHINGLVLFCVEKRLLLAVGPRSGLHAGDLMKQLVGFFDLKGGGGPTLAQAGGADPKLMEDYKKMLAALVDNA
jgi:alanyl-tRNA synthetase